MFLGKSHPPYPDLQPTVERQVNGVCNYNCSYCIQSRARRIGMPSRQTVEHILTAFNRLPGIWEIKMSGGEPFAFHGFMKWVIPGIVERTRHFISILTNLSADSSTLETFSRATGERLRVFSASYHPEFADLDGFIDKAVFLSSLLRKNNPLAQMVINSVVVPDRIPFQFELKARLEKAGLRYFPQLMKVKGYLYPYDTAALKSIETLTEGRESPHDMNRSPNYQGIHCEAGAWYFVVDQRGMAYTCRMAKRFAEEDDNGCMGSLVDGSFSRKREGRPCPYTICPCTVPANRGIIRLHRSAEGEGASRGL